MAKPPTMHCESEREYEARLLRQGWYDNRPEEQRQRATTIANGYEFGPSSPHRVGSLMWAMDKSVAVRVLVATVAIETGLLVPLLLG